MKIIGISGSPRGEKSNSRRLLVRVLEGAKTTGAEVELIDLSNVKLDYCVACETCHVSGICTRDDDFWHIHDKMLESDGIVLASPVYFNSVTAQLKTAIDRLADVIHCQRFLGKYACSVSTAGGPEHDLAINYMNELLIRFGCYVVGGVGATMAFPESFEQAEQDALALGKELVSAITEKRDYPEQKSVHSAMHERFKRLITINKDNWPYEYSYWAERGWLW